MGPRPFNEEIVLRDRIVECLEVADSEKGAKECGIERVEKGGPAEDPAQALGQRKEHFFGEEREEDGKRVTRTTVIGAAAVCSEDGLQTMRRGTQAPSAERQHGKSRRPSTHQCHTASSLTFRLFHTAMPRSSDFISASRSSREIGARGRVVMTDSSRLGANRCGTSAARTTGREAKSKIKTLLCMSFLMGISFFVITPFQKFWLRIRLALYASPPTRTLTQSHYP